jgi:hypothetical protein
MTDQHSRVYDFQKNGHGRVLHPDEDRCYACPDCDEPGPTYRRRDNRTVAPDQPVACYNCSRGWSLGDLVLREVVRSGGNPVGDAGEALRDLDPDTDIREVAD